MAKKNTKKDEMNIFQALDFFEEQRGIPKEFIAEKIADAIVVAARKDYGEDNVTCTIDCDKEIFDVRARKQVVDEVENRFTQISKEDALKIDPNAVENGFVDIKLDPAKFGRIIAQNSKNNFRQGVREA